MKSAGFAKVDNDVVDLGLVRRIASWLELEHEVEWHEDFDKFQLFALKRTPKFTLRSVLELLSKGLSLMQAEREASRSSSSEAGRLPV